MLRTHFENGRHLAAIATVGPFKGLTIYVWVTLQIIWFWFALQAEIEVYRRDSRKKPSLDDKSIDWEETVYLNIILHQVCRILVCVNHHCTEFELVWKTEHVEIHLTLVVVVFIALNSGPKH